MARNCHNTPGLPLGTLNGNQLSDHDKLCAAISIVQAHILALHSTLDAEKMFGHLHMAPPALELAERMMCDVLDGIVDAEPIGGAA